MTGQISIPTARAQVGLGVHSDWHEALAQALAGLRIDRPDLVCAFVGGVFASDLPAIADRIWRALGAPIVFGASGQGVFVHHTESENEPSITIMALTLPGAVISPVRISPSSLTGSHDPIAFRRRIGVLQEDVRGWIVLANPFRFDIQALITDLGDAYPGMPILGGVASPDHESRQSALVLNGEALFDGAIAIGIGGPYDLFPIVSLGADPLGETWTITGVEGEWIESISNRPAIEMMEETLKQVPHDLRDRARRNMLVGFAIDEYQLEFIRGDFVLRSITGVDQKSGAIATGFTPRIGQTVQFQLRDAATGDLDLTLSLDGARLEMTGRRPVAAIGFAGTGRGVNLFGTPHHDAALVQRKFPAVPTIGLFSAAEIGPVGKQIVLNSHSLTLGLIIAR